jgi:integrase/recombinase XerD
MKMCPTITSFNRSAKRGQKDRRGQLDHTAVNRIVKNASQLIGIKNLSPHWLRHYHASSALDRGATVEGVKETMGHRAWL